MGNEKSWYQNTNGAKIFFEEFIQRNNKTKKRWYCHPNGKDDVITIDKEGTVDWQEWKKYGVYYINSDDSQPPLTGWKEMGKDAAYQCYYSKKKHEVPGCGFGCKGTKTDDNTWQHKNVCSKCNKPWRGQQDSARAYFTRQLTLQTKDIEFENTAAFVEETVARIMTAFRRKSQIAKKKSWEEPWPVKSWEDSLEWVMLQIAKKKVKPETGGTACSRSDCSKPQQGSHVVSTKLTNDLPEVEVDSKAEVRKIRRLVEVSHHRTQGDAIGFPEASAMIAGLTVTLLLGRYLFRRFWEQKTD